MPEPARPGPPDLALWREVVCPFCGLACDDLTVERRGSRLALLEGGCPKAKARFEQPFPTDAMPQIEGRPVALAEAIARAAALLRGCRLPVFGGLGADLAGVRAVLQLADRLGGVVDHLGSDALFRNLGVLQDAAGWTPTTLSEVRNRMDLMLVVGRSPEQAFPRFFERCVRPPQTLFEPGPPARAVIRLGPPRSEPAPAGDAGAAIEEIPCPLDRLPEVVAALRALAGGAPLHVAEVAGGLPVERLRAVAERLRAARYGIVAWAAADFDWPQGELVVRALASLATELNRTTRCSLLPLGGDDDLIGANQACVWQTGLPLRTGFGAGGGPEHDRFLFSARRLAASGEADALVWISAFRPTPPPLAAGLPVVLLATPDTAWAEPPAVFIPVATPGVDHAGQVFRMDAIVSLPLRGLRSSPLPSVAQAIGEIEAALAAAPPGAPPA